ncbi:hypothetical protein [Microbulbifer variabilis]|uniref:hypothetical protein n=1 Tax=Microbulbifer variabilis TaxID=266805 RepID=UPI001CFCE622|nr:hypothetical protein [Microbulbifer variabilis]
MIFWKWITGAAALIFCGTSVVFTVGLWISIPSAEGEPLVWGLTAGGVVAGLTAAALELCKFSFAPLGLWLRSQGRFIGNVLLFLWPFLVLISIGATVGFLESHTTEQQQVSAVNSVEYQTLKQQLNSYNQRINNINGIIADYAATDFRKVAVKTDKRLDELEARRDEVLAQLKSVQGSTTDSAQAAFSGLATLTHLDASKIQHSAFLALAVITDLVGLVALLAFNSAVTVKSNQNESLTELVTVNQAETDKSGEVTKEPENQILTTASQLTPEQQQLAQRIAAGEYGEKPVMRNINREVRGGNNVVQPVFEYLEKAGVLTRSGRGFALCNDVLVNHS